MQFEKVDAHTGKNWRKTGEKLEKTGKNWKKLEKTSRRIGKS
jgi:hypothetical protein